MQTESTAKRKATVRRFPTATMLLAGLLSAGAFCACSEGSESMLGEQHEVMIVPSVAFLQGGIDAQHAMPQTKAPVDGNTALTLYFARADETVAGAYGNYATSSLAATRAAGSGATALTFSPPQYYLVDGRKTKLAGWYPQAASFSAGIASWTLDGQQDLMTATAQQGTKTSAMPGFTFTHRLAQLQFYPYADNERIAGSWGKILKIEVQAQPNKATYTLSSDALAFSGSEVFSADVPADGTVIASSKAVAAMVGKAVMIAPQDAENYMLTVEVTTEKQGKKSVTITRKFEAGIPYKIYLCFVQLEMIITPEVTISNWIAGYEIPVKTDPVTEPGIDVGDWGTGTNEGVDY